jgi:thymidylate synthase (FAD)
MIKDSGERTEFGTGAVRDMHSGKGRMDLLPWEALVEVSKHCEEGALKYGERNCEKGIPIHSLIDSAFRHRMASYCQESTRYCNYGKGKFGEEITVIEPCFWPEGSDLYWAWKNACLISEQCYFSLLKSGATPQEARSVLPNSLKTEVVMTANIREWRHFLKLRCSPAAHPQMREVALILLDKVHALIPVCFDDIWSEYHADV